jgi:hypothetical protein
LFGPEVALNWLFPYPTLPPPPPCQAWWAAKPGPRTPPPQVRAAADPHWVLRTLLKPALGFKDACLKTRLSP